MRFSSLRYILKESCNLCVGWNEEYFITFFPGIIFYFGKLGKVLNSDLKYCEIKSIKFLETIHDVFAGFQIKYKRFLKDFLKNLSTAN